MDIEQVAAALSRAKEAEAYINKVEKEAHEKWGDELGRLICLAASISFVANNSVCPHHGTPECTCDPRASLERAIQGLAMITREVDNFVAHRVPKVLSPDDSPILASKIEAVADGVRGLLDKFEHAKNIAEGVEDSEGGNPVTVDAASFVPPSNIVQ